MKPTKEEIEDKIIKECLNDIQYYEPKTDDGGYIDLNVEIVLKKAISLTLAECQKQKEEEIKKLLNEIGDRFYYSSEVDGVDLKLNELEEYQEFKEEKIENNTFPHPKG